MSLKSQILQHLGTQSVMGKKKPSQSKAGLDPQELQIIKWSEREEKNKTPWEKRRKTWWRTFRNANSQLILKIQIQTPDILEDKLAER